MSQTIWIINQYASTPETGMGGRHFYLARELAKQGYNVYLIGASYHHLLREPPSLDSFFKLEPVDGFTFVWVKVPSYLDAHSKQRAVNWFVFPWRLRGLPSVIDDKPDAILCSSPSPMAFLGANWLAKQFGSRLVFEVRDIWPLTLTEIGGYSPAHPFVRMMQWVEDKAYRDSDHVVSNLKNSVDHMVSRGMRSEKFTWIPNGVSLDEISLKAPLNAVTKSQLPDGRFVIGYAGTLGAANALDTLIKAAEYLREHRDIVFVIVGGGKEKPVLERQVRTRGLDNVIFLDPVPKVEIQALLAGFDACFIGLTKDPLFRFGVSPNKLFDYLYSGNPVIYAIDSGGYEPVNDAGAGCQVPAENPEKLAEAVLHLSALPQEVRDSMGANGRRVVLDQYEYGMLAEKLARVLMRDLC